MTYGANPKTASPAASKAGGGIYENNAGTIVLGWKGGRVMEYSDIRGPALPPVSVDTEGTIDSYSAGTFPGTSPYFIARQSETLTEYDYKGDATQTAYNRYYGAMCHMSDTNWDKHWPGSDWTNGLIVHIVSGTGAGQWGILENRDPDDAWKFQLVHPFATAPAAGDRFVIGSLVWITLADLSAPPMMGEITIQEGQLVCKLRAGTPKWIIEAYTGGDNWEVANPPHPYSPGTVRSVELRLSDTRQPTLWNLNSTTGDGFGSRGREVSLSIIGIVGHEDYLVDTLAAYAHVHGKT